MSLRELLVALDDVHATLIQANGKLRIVADKGALPALLPHLRGHKPALLALVADGGLDYATREARAHAAWMAEGWNHPAWVDVDKLLAHIDRPRRPVRVIPMTWGRRR